jgi:uncharacterized protein (DUF1501 family)
VSPTNLAAPNEPKRGVSRRRFLQVGGAGLAGAALSPYLSSLRAFAAPPVGAHDGILVTIVLEGGNDGMNMLCPIGSSRYYSLRPTIAVPKAQALKLSSAVGLHPVMTRFKRQWDLGRLAVIQGIGYANPDLSHFTSMDIWMRGWGGSGTPSTGWLGRWLDTLPNTATESLYGVTIDDSVPRHFMGARSHASSLPLSVSDAFGMDREDASDRRMYTAVGAYGNDPSGVGAWGDAYGDALAQLMNVTVKIGPAYNHTFPSSYIAKQLALCAYLINANLGIRALNVHLGGFDTHTDQAGWHHDLLAQLDYAIGTFWGAVAPAWRSRVAVMTFSEFGRRPEENGGAGTDHGTASVAFLMGPNVRGGLHSTYPSLTSLDPYGNVKPSVDFRRMYAAILSKWLKANPTAVLGHDYKALDLFRAGPGY